MSGIPRQLGISFAQKIVIPVLYFIIVCWVPVWMLEISKKKQKPSVAVGQFMLFERNFYCELGGHEMVKNRIMEDVWFAVETTRKGGRYRFANLSEVVTCSMYTNLGDMWSGVLKWMYSVASISTLALAALMAMGYILFFAPFYALYNQLFVLPFHSAWFLIIVFQVSVVLLMRLIVMVRLREPIVSPVFHPLGFAFVFTTCVYAAISWLRKDGVRWKERIYGGHSSIR
jgi:chlorobactene glucosyltransferase